MTASIKLSISYRQPAAGHQYSQKNYEVEFLFFKFHIRFRVQSEYLPSKRSTPPVSCLWNSGCLKVLIDVKHNFEVCTELGHAPTLPTSTTRAEIWKLAKKCVVQILNILKEMYFQIKSFKTLYLVRTTLLLKNDILTI